MPSLTPNLASLIEGQEWYDNSTLSLIDSCHRKGFFAKELEVSRLNQETGEKEVKKGLRASAGAGAFYGTCTHHALGKYYGMRKLGFPSQKSRLEALTAFATIHGKLFPDNLVEDRKHSLERGLQVLDLYFDHYAMEDELLIPIDIELTAIVRIVPEPDEKSFEPFLYVMRADGIMDRRNSNDRWVFETKTTSGGVDRELQKLKMSRQPTGYQWVLNQFESEKYIVGVIGNVIGVLRDEQKAEKLFKRDYMRRTRKDLALWRRQTINKVERWRAMKREAEGKDLFTILSIFDQRTDECTNYGLCPFYNLCFYNLETVDLENLAANDWNPIRGGDPV